MERVMRWSVLAPSGALGGTVTVTAMAKRY